MAAATILAVSVVNNPAPFSEQIVLQVQYECYTALQDDLEWKVIYVGSAESESHDQVLDSAFVGPVTPGTYQFRMECPPPDPTRIPSADLVGVTALLLTCSYRGKEFVRVGYYVNNEYTDAALLEAPPDPPLLDKLERNVLADHPRVTKFAIEFDEPLPGGGGGAEAAAAPEGGDAGGFGGGGFGAAALPPAGGQENVQPLGGGGNVMFGGGGGDMEMDKPMSQ